MNYNWDWAILLQPPNADLLIEGVGWTLSVTSLSWAIALVVGSCIGTLRGLPWTPGRMLARAYVEIFRNVPPLVQLFLWFFVFPEIMPDSVGLWIKRDMPLPEFTTAVVCIGLFSAARVAEQVRAGVDLVRVRLLPAALATGLRPLQAYRLVILPVALRSIVGPLTSELLITTKMSSIGLTIGVLELTSQSQRIANDTFHGFEAYAAATAGYLVIGLVITGIMHAIATRLNASILRPV
jgi:glutamate/aspartate transport system permease protein